MMAFISVDVDIDIEDHLDDVSTDALIEELASRKAGHAGFGGRDWYILAELIAGGSCREALQLLKEIAPVEINPNLIFLLSDARRAA